MAVQCHVWHCTATFKKTKRVCKQNFSLSLKDAPAALPLFARTDETLVMLYSIITINLEIILYDCFILNPPKVLHLPTSFRIGTPDQPVIHFSSLAHLCPLVYIQLIYNDGTSTFPQVKAVFYSLFVCILL